MARLCMAIVFVVMLTSSLRAPAEALMPAQGVQQDQAVVAATEVSAAQLEQQGDMLRARKNYDQALLNYEKALRIEPNNATLYNKRGITKLQLNDFMAAQRDFQRAIKKNPKYAEAFNNLGVAAYLQHNYKKAIKQYQKALQLREDNASVHSNLGTAWFAQRQIEKAMAEYARAIELDPDVLLRTSSGGVAARVLSPEDRAYFSYILAKMYAKRGDIERCLECLRKAREEGYTRIKDVHKDSEFALVRTDPRFVELMGTPPQE